MIRSDKLHPFHLRAPPYSRALLFIFTLQLLTSLLLDPIHQSLPSIQPLPNLCTLAESAKTYDTKCKSGWGNDIESVADMSNECGLIDSTPACPLTAAESNAATNSITPPFIGSSSSYLGGVQTHSTTPSMIIWTWNLSPQHGTIFWVQPDKNTGVSGGYAPGTSYENWGSGSTPPSTTGQFLSTTNSLLGRGPWSTLAIDATDCVTCQKESCIDACSNDRSAYNFHL